MVVILSFSAIAQNREIKTFSKAKRNLKKLYNKTSLEKKTIYCGCEFSNKKIDVSIGTITPPPPIPSKPAIKPTKDPKTKNDNTHSISNIYNSLRNLF